MKARGGRYVAALGLKSLNRLYDPLLRVTMPERAFKCRLLDQAHLSSGVHVLDIGCGTGTLLMMAEDRRETSHLFGVDGDLSILGLAAGKATKSSRHIRFVAGLGEQLPFSSEIFDRALSSLMLHHLTREEKRATVSEAFRVLRPGGELHVADWGPPHTLAMRVASMTLRSFEHADRTADNLAGRIPQLCRDAGFSQVRTTTRFRTIFGTLELLAAFKR